MTTHNCVLAQVLRRLLDMLASHRVSDQQKDLEILLLRYQLIITKRRLSRPHRVAQWEKGTLAVIAV